MPSPPASSNLSIRVSLGALRRNLRLLRVRTPGAVLSALVKADGYGHGALDVARVALEEGCQFLIVADLAEALALRQGGVQGDILIVGPILPDEAPEVIANRFVIALGNLDVAHALDHAARAQGQRARVHLKFDTGMGRFGFLDSSETLDSALPLLAAASGLEIEGALTHFSEADEPASDFTHEQTRRFQTILEAIKAQGFRPRWVHAANSGAVEHFPQTAFSMVRLGIAMYGGQPNPALEPTLALEPVMTATARVVDTRQVPAGHPVSYGRSFVTHRPSQLALLPVGYGHGYPRSASSRAHIQLHGQRAPIVGRVTMNLTVVDVTDIQKGVRPGDSATLFGDGGPSVEELAQAADTIPYEILCNMGRAAPRRFDDDDAESSGA